jgi:hypothetical protein
MMDHAHYRSAILADPRASDAELRAHRESCPECHAFTEQLLRFESRLERALRVQFPPTADVLPFERKAAAAAPGPWRWLAMAASVLLGLVVAGGVWLTLPQRSLAADVVAHMAGEPAHRGCRARARIERRAAAVKNSLETRRRRRQLRQQLRF